MLKDSGPWHFVVARGDNIVDLIKEKFTYIVSVKGNILLDLTHRICSIIFRKRIRKIIFEYIFNPKQIQTLHLIQQNIIQQKGPFLFFLQQFLQLPQKVYVIAYIFLMITNIYIIENM